MPDQRKRARRDIDKVGINGLLDLRKEFTAHIKADDANFASLHSSISEIKHTLEEYIKSDMTWKSENKTALENMKNLSAGWKVILTIFGSVGLIAAGVVGMKSILSIFNQKS